MIRFHALAIHMYNELGHKFDYHLCVRSAIHKLGLAYKGYANKECDIKNLPADWEQCLTWNPGDKFHQKTAQLFKRTRCFNHIFRRKPEPNEIRVFFIESLYINDLVALTISTLLFGKKTDHLWLFLRDALPSGSLKEKIFRFFLQLLQKKMKMRLTLLTDSSRVQHYYEHLLNQTLHLVPIPHTALPLQTINSSSTCVLWWPGRPDFEKGSDKIQALASLKNMSKVEIHLSEWAKTWLQNPPPHFKFIKPVLSREEYWEQFKMSDAILLPYDPNAYFAKTSGIFTESIFAGRPPFVLEGSFLANELHKHNLPELILDWNRPDLLSHIVEVLNDKIVRKKLQAMQKSYMSYHSLPSYTKELEKIIKHSQTDCT